jgi:hypothetical protein
LSVGVVIRLFGPETRFDGLFSEQRLMLNACEHMEKLLRLKQEDPGAYFQKIMGFSLQFCREWERQSGQTPDQTSDTSTTAADSASRPGQQSAEP